MEEKPELIEFLKSQPNLMSCSTCSEVLKALWDESEEPFDLRPEDEID